MFKRTGLMLMATAALHQGVGLIFYNQPLMDMLRAGLLNSVTAPYWDRDAAFWFFMFGFMLALFGAITHWLLQTVERLPRFWGWGLLSLCMLGVVMMPVSGFWIALAIAVLMVRQNKSVPVPQQPQLAH